MELSEGQEYIEHVKGGRVFHSKDGKSYPMEQNPRTGEWGYRLPENNNILVRFVHAILPIKISRSADEGPNAQRLPKPLEEVDDWGRRPGEE